MSLASQKITQLSQTKRQHNDRIVIFNNKDDDSIEGKIPSIPRVGKPRVGQKRVVICIESCDGYPTTKRPRREVKRPIRII